MAFIIKKDPISGHESRIYTSDPPKSSGSKSSGSPGSASGSKTYSSGGSSGSGSSGSSKSSGGLLGGVAGGLSSAIQNAVKNKTGGSSSSGSGGAGSSGGSSAVNRNYHQEAADAAARGDWAAVSKALAARQAKINQQGGNDRGTSNASILAGLQKQYADSYGRLSPTNRQTVSAMASGGYAGDGYGSNPRGWEDGRDYLASAKQYAQAGDLDAAYNELMRRGFKLYDTGGSGGTTQDQAYALIHQLYNQSAGARSSYESALRENAGLLAAHPTQFGNVQNPALANKHFVSQDGQYIIYYDSTGTPMHAQPNNGQYSSTKYTPEYRDLMERYYSGDDNFADLKRQMHNLDVAYSGNGRLVDQYGNWASGSPAEPVSAYDWQGYTPNMDLNRGQSSEALKALLAQINAGQSFGVLGGGQAGGGPASVPITRPVQQPGAPGSGSGSGGVAAPGSPGGSMGYGDGDLTQYIQTMYEENLAAQLAQLKASYEQNRADIQAQDDLIAQVYQDQRNQAAGQNDLQRMYLAEMGAANGLNTGAAGQMGLAQAMVYQNALANLGVSENQALAENGLALNQLTSGYRGAVDSASAQSGARLSEALYSELVRQIEAETARQEAARQQANWQAQFDYQKQQDADALQYQLAQMQAAADKQGASNAWDLAQLMLKNGVVPDAGTLSMAGIDPGSAQALADSYRAQLAARQRTGGGGSGGSGKPRLSESAVLKAIEEGRVTDDVITAYDYYYGGGAYQQYYGDQGGGTGMASGGVGFNFDSFRRSIAEQLSNGNDSRAIAYTDSVWNSLTDQQRQDVQTLLAGYGRRYNP